MKISTPDGTIQVSHSGNHRVWYFRTYPFKVIWYLEQTPGKQASKRFALAGELAQFLLTQWGANVSEVFTTWQFSPNKY